MRTDAPWHKQSFDRFLHQYLPQLLLERLPLTGCEAEAENEGTCSVRLAVSGEGRTAEARFTGLPCPDETGVFTRDGVEYVVVPTASSEDLEVADVKCVGEQLRDFVAERLGEAPNSLAWDDELLGKWVPLDDWMDSFLGSSANCGRLDTTNWLARRTHLRRLSIPDRERLTAPGQQGRVCPYETPEGTNIGRVLSIALGAEIRDGRMVIADNDPRGALGLSASCVPFLEHTDPVRALMGCNMMRQWLVPPDREPALVQTGDEPEAAEFWCGRNLLTAFISWGGDTFEDGIVVSESAAARLGYPAPLEPGDKLSNRHGQKGVVSRILPDDAMPHLADGTAADIIVSFIGLHTRLNFGQIREAVMGRIARAEGEPAVVPPFKAPGADELKSRLEAAGLSPTGMEVLTDPGTRRALERPSTVGWVYWGKTFHLVGDKAHACSGKGDPDFPELSSRRPNLQSHFEYAFLRDAGAFELVREHFNTRAEERSDSGSLARRVARGAVEQAGPPTPAFEKLCRRLLAFGIRAELSSDGVTFAVCEPAEPALGLAVPVAHPWRRKATLERVAVLQENTPEFRAVAEENDRVARLLKGKPPQSLHDQAVGRLGQAVGRYADASVGARQLEFSNRSLFSGRSVIAPGADLRLEELGLPEEMAWAIFAPLVARETACKGAPEPESQGPTEALDTVMQRNWVLLNRAPSVAPGSILAFRPVRVAGRAIRLQPLACRLMNADFDGDAAAVFLPLTEAGQQEAAEVLSVRGLLRRHPEYIEWVAPTHEAIWGLAALSLTTDGPDRINDAAGVSLAAEGAMLDRAAVVRLLRTLTDGQGVAVAIRVAEELMALGLQAARASGASLSPFPADDFRFPAAPEGNAPEDRIAFVRETEDALAARTDFGSVALGPQLAAVRSGARGEVAHLQYLLGGREPVQGLDESPVMLTHAPNEGLTPKEAFACAASGRRALGDGALEAVRRAYRLRQEKAPEGFGVLARAMRAERPGIVFARAAATAEVDPLTDIDSRLFVGLRAR